MTIYEGSSFSIFVYIFKYLYTIFFRSHRGAAGNSSIRFAYFRSIPASLLYGHWAYPPFQLGEGRYQQFSLMEAYPPFQLREGRFQQFSKVRRKRTHPFSWGKGVTSRLVRLEGGVPTLSVGGSVNSISVGWRRTHPLSWGTGVSSISIRLEGGVPTISIGGRLYLRASKINKYMFCNILF